MDKKPFTGYRFSLPVRIVIIVAVSVIAVLTTLLVLPLARLMSLDPSQLQGAGFQPTFKTMTIGILYSASQFLLIWLVMALVHRRSFSSLGFRGKFWRPLLTGSAIGIGLAAAETGINCLIGGDVSLAWNVPPEASAVSVIGYFLLWVLFLLTLNSLKEELVFRAYPIEQFNDRPQAGFLVIIAVSLIFAGVHHVLEPFTISKFLSRFFIALIFAYAYFRWRSMWLIVGIHNGTNFVSFLLYAHWKSGGLLSLDYKSPPDSAVIVIDLGVKLAGLALLHYAWRRGRVLKGPVKG